MRRCAPHFLWFNFFKWSRFTNSLCITLVLFSFVACSYAQQPAANQGIQPVLITLKDALERAKKYGGQVQTAELAARLAHEDRVQAKAGLLPTLSAFNQFVYTEGNGTPSGVFVANDGVHVYNEQAVVHQDLFSIVRRGELRRARAAEAVAQARRDLAVRGLNLTVTQDYYAIVVTQRKAANARTSLGDAAEFLDITQKQEQRGEAAHSDTIKAQIQKQQRERDLQDAEVAIEKAKVALGVLIFSDVVQDFGVEDDLDHAPSLDAMEAVRAKAMSLSPDLRAAEGTVNQAQSERNVATYAFLPSLGVDFYYGIDANQFAVNSALTQATGRSTLPNYLVSGRHNLGYSAAVTLNIPIWDWGTIRSRVRQAKFREGQAQFDLTVAKKQVGADIATAYLEARTAQQQLASLRSSVELSQESLRLTTLRYKAGEATVLEVVDAQTTLATARTAYADGLLRYRTAIAAIQALTGQF